MTEWGVVGVIIAIVGLIVSVVTPLIKLNSTIVTLSTQVKSLLDGLDEFKNRYKDHLRELQDVDQKQYRLIDDHERRITRLETQREDDMR